MGMRGADAVSDAPGRHARSTGDRSGQPDLLLRGLSEQSKRARHRWGAREARISRVGTIDAGPLPAGGLNDVLPRAGTMDNSRTSIRRSIRVRSFRFPTNNTLH